MPAGQKKTGGQGPPAGKPQQAQAGKGSQPAPKGGPNKGGPQGGKSQPPQGGQGQKKGGGAGNRLPQLGSLLYAPLIRTHTLSHMPLSYLLFIDAPYVLTGDKRKR